MTDDDARKLARAFVQELRGLLGGHVVQRTEPSDPVFMKIGAYAKSRGYSRSTIQEYLNAGMPHVGGRGGRRVDVRAADEWIKMGAAAREMHS